MSCGEEWQISADLVVEEKSSRIDSRICVTSLVTFYVADLFSIQRSSSSIKSNYSLSNSRQRTQLEDLKWLDGFVVQQERSPERTFPADPSPIGCLALAAVRSPQLTHCSQTSGDNIILSMARHGEWKNWVCLCEVRSSQFPQLLRSDRRKMPSLKSVMQDDIRW